MGFISKMEHTEWNYQDIFETGHSHVLPDLPHESQWEWKYPNLGYKWGRKVNTNELASHYFDVYKQSSHGRIFRRMLCHMVVIYMARCKSRGKQQLELCWRRKGPEFCDEELS